MEQRINCRQSILCVAEIAAAAIDEQPDQYDEEHSHAVIAATKCAYDFRDDDTVLVHGPEMGD